MRCLIFLLLPLQTVVGTNVWFPGNYTIGGIYASHIYNTSNYNQCSNKTVTDTYILLSQAHLFSTRYANDHILNNKDFKLGAWLVDSCSSNSVALQNSVPFIQQASNSLCSERDVSAFLNTDQPFTVTGAMNSDIAKNINYLLQAFCAPLVASISTSTEFDEEQQYPYFLRSVASDKYQAKAVLYILQKLQWTHVLVVYQISSSYGYHLYVQFEKYINSQTRNPKICVEDYIGLADWIEPSSLFSVYDHLIKPASPRIIVVFAEYMLIMELFKEINRWIDNKNLSGPYQFIGVDHMSVLDFNETMRKLVNNSIAISPGYDPIPAFLDELDNITLKSISNANPWVANLIKQQHNCCYLYDFLYENCSDKNTCYGTEKLRKPYGIAGLSRSRLVFRTVSIIAYGLRTLQESICGLHNKEFCEDLVKEITGKLLYAYMRNVSYHNEVDSFQFFNHTNSGPPLYNILQYQIGRNVSEGAGWIKVGKYSGNGVESFDSNTNGENLISPPYLLRYINNCQRNCPVRFALVGLKNSTCCNECQSCKDNPFKYVKNNISCEICDNGKIPKKPYYEDCVDAKQVSLVGHLDATFLAILTLGGVGLIISCLCFAAIVFKFNTPMVKAALGKLLCSQCITLCLMFACPLILLPNSSGWSCMLGWIVTTTVIALGHAITILKFIRICCPRWWISLICYNIASSHLLTPTCIIVLVAIQFLFAVVWACLRPPIILAIKFFDKAQYYYECSACSEAHSLVLFICPFIILLLMGIVLKRALQSPYSYQILQTRFAIAGCVSIFCNYVCMLSVSFILRDKIEHQKIHVFMMLVLMNGYSTLLSVVVPIVYLLLATPHNNSEDYVARKRLKSHRFSEGNVVYFLNPEILPPCENLQSD